MIIIDEETIGGSRVVEYGERGPELSTIVVWENGTTVTVASSTYAGDLRGLNFNREAVEHLRDQLTTWLEAAK